MGGLFIFLLSLSPVLCKGSSIMRMKQILHQPLPQPRPPFLRMYGMYVDINLSGNVVSIEIIA